MFVGVVSWYVTSVIGTNSRCTLKFGLKTTVLKKSPRNLVFLRRFVAVMQVSSAPLQSRSGAEQAQVFGSRAERSGARFFFWCWSGAERSRTFFLVLERSRAEQDIFFWCWSGAEQDTFFGVGAERSGAGNFFGTWSGAERIGVERSGAELYWKQITGA